MVRPLNLLALSLRNCILFIKEPKKRIIEDKLAIFYDKIAMQTTLKNMPKIFPEKSLAIYHPVGRKKAT